MRFNQSKKKAQAVRLEHFGKPNNDIMPSSGVVLSIIGIALLALAALHVSRSGFIGSDSEHTAGSPDAKKASSDSAQMAKKHVRALVSPYINQNQYPSTITEGTSSTDASPKTLDIEYTLDTSLQEWVEQRIARYNPDRAAFVAIDPDTGEVLAMVSSTRNQPVNKINLTLQSTYPAASTFKYITAAAAIEEGHATPNTLFSFNGKSTSLYKKQVYEVKPSKWLRELDLKTAFAKSVNPIFGRIGIKLLGADTLVSYAEKFGFNARFQTDFEFDNGHISIDNQDDWQTVESASGYTRRNTLSPMHAAIIAASAVNGGKLVAPVLINKITQADNQQVLYERPAPVLLPAISAQTAESMQTLMHHTVIKGTGRKSFRNFFKGDNATINVGGKTGTLNGRNPKGAYDWFIGYGMKDGRKIAYAMLCINTEKWYVKSSRFAREVIHHYFKKPIIDETVS